MIANSPKDLASIVKEQRKKLKLSQTTASEAVGLKQATLSAFENYPDSTKLETLFRILSAMNLTLDIKTKSDTAQWKEEW